MRYLYSGGDEIFEEDGSVARVKSRAPVLNWTKPTARYAAQLREEINRCNYAWASAHGLRHRLTYGSPPCVFYAPDEAGRHGNFLSLSYGAIRARADWARRLEKVLTTARSSLAREDRRWRELDSAHSSDALLMNVFCYSGVTEDAALRALLGLGAGESGMGQPVFGVRIGVPLSNGRADRTEIDMQMGDLLVEAKLTESNFQSAPLRLLTRYRDWEEVFDIGALPQQGETFFGYQLIRGALAAYAQGASFCVLCDARRPDLVEAWYAVMRAVRLYELRHRLKLLTWQELAGVLPGELALFLEQKYGIAAAACRLVAG
jgi:hypothetical protein